MRQRRYREDQIIGILKESEAGGKMKNINLFMFLFLMFFLFQLHAESSNQIGKLGISILWDYRYSSSNENLAPGPTAAYPREKYNMNLHGLGVKYFYNDSAFFDLTSKILFEPILVGHYESNSGSNMVEYKSTSISINRVIWKKQKYSCFIGGGINHITAFLDQYVNATGIELGRADKTSGLLKLGLEQLAREDVSLCIILNIDSNQDLKFKYTDSEFYEYKIAPVSFTASISIRL